MTGAALEARLREADTGGAAADRPLVVDVRSRFEFSRGHVPGAVHVPFWLVPFRAGRLASGSEPFASRHGRDGTRPPLVVYCGHGPRAWWAGAWLRRAGFARVEYLDGHITRWYREGRPVER